MFLTGFLFTSILLYLIITQEELLSLGGAIGVAAGAGLVVGVITDARAIHWTLLHWIPVRSDYSPRCAYNSTSNQGETISGRDDRTCF